MEDFVYYVARISFSLLLLYGLFLVGVSVLQIISLLTTHRDWAGTPSFLLVQLLHGVTSFTVGLVLNLFLGTEWGWTLVLLVSSWAYMTFEDFARRWYTARFVH